MAGLATDAGHASSAGPLACQWPGEQGSAAVTAGHMPAQVSDRTGRDRHDLHTGSQGLYARSRVPVTCPSGRTVAVVYGHSRRNAVPLTCANGFAAGPGHVPSRSCITVH